MGDVGQNVRTSSYKSWGVMYSMMTKVNDTLLYILKLLREQIFF